VNSIRRARHPARRSSAGRLREVFDPDHRVVPVAVGPVEPQCGPVVGLDTNDELPHAPVGRPGLGRLRQRCTHAEGTVRGAQARGAAGSTAQAEQARAPAVGGVATAPTRRSAANSPAKSSIAHALAGPQQVQGRGQLRADLHKQLRTGRAMRRPRGPGRTRAVRRDVALDYPAPRSILPCPISSQNRACRSNHGVSGADRLRCWAHTAVVEACISMQRRREPTEHEVGAQREPVPPRRPGRGSVTVPALLSH